MMFVGMQTAGNTLNVYSSKYQVATVSDTGTKGAEVSLPEWPTSEAYSGAWRYLDLSSTIKRAFLM